MEKEINNNKESYNSFTLINIISIFLNNRLKILFITLFFCIISIILYFFVFDLIYQSTASIKSSSQKTSLLSGIEGIPDISGLDDIGIGGGGKSAKDLAAYEEILTSRRCLETLINKFDLMKRDEFKFMEDAVKNFKDNKMLLTEERLSGLLKISVYDKDPNLAKEMVDFLIEQLDKINIELNIQNAKNNREFIERRYFQAKDDLSKAEDSLKSFQLIYGVAPDLQIKASAQSVFALEAELKSEEVKLDVIKKLLNSDQPEVKMQETKVNSLKSQILEIQTSTNINDFIRLGNSPQIAMSFLRLQRDVEIQTKILVFLLPVYEQAKIEEKKETPTIIILDKPIIAEKKSKPKRLTMVIVFTFAGFFLALTYFIVKYKWIIFKNSDSYKSLKALKVK